MPRPVDWEVVGQGSDPVPGDPQTIRSLATEYGRIATAAADAATRLRAASGSGWMADWQGAASQVFAEAIKDTPSDLSKLHASYSRASSALSGWAGVVDDTQYRADGALADAKDAAGDLHRAESRLAAAQQTLSHYQTVATGLATTAAQYPSGSAAPSGVSVPTAAQLRAASDNTTVAQSGVDAASGSVAAAQSRIDAATRLVAAAKSDWEDGAQRTAHAIGDAADAGLGKQSFWSSLFHSEIWTELVSVAQVVVAVGSIVAMIVPGPWTLVIAAVALIVVADTLYKMSEGKASGWDLAFALLNCVPAAGAVGEAVRGTEFAARLGDAVAASGVATRVGGVAERVGSLTRSAGAVVGERAAAVVGRMSRAFRAGDESETAANDALTWGHTYFDEDAANTFYLKPDAPTLGAPGQPVFFMPESEAIEHIHSDYDAMIRTGLAPRVVRAVDDGTPVYGLRMNVEGLEYRLPTEEESAGNPNFLPGGRTAVALDGGFMVNPIHEFVFDGLDHMPAGTQLFRLDGGARTVIHEF